MGLCCSSKNEEFICNNNDQPSQEQLPTNNSTLSVTKSLNYLTPLNRNFLSLSERQLQKQINNSFTDCQIDEQIRETPKYNQHLKSYDELEEENYKLKEEINKLHKTISCHCQGSTKQECNTPKNDILCVERAGILFDCNRQGYICTGNLKECLHLSRLTKIMKEFIDGNIKHIETINMSMILNNFIHLLETHNKYDEDFECIVDTFGNCDIMNCNIFQRNYRIRRKDELLPTNDEYKRNVVHSQILDKIHCFYSHCFDIGNKICSKDNLSIETCPKYKSESELDEFCLENRQVMKLNRILQNKRNRLKTLDGFNMRIKLKSTPQLDRSDNSEQADNRYHFGLQIKYKQCSYTPMNAEVFASPQYSDLREEIIDNDICCLNKNQFDIELEKAKIHFDCWYRRQHYSKLLIKHLVSLMIYCNYTTLQSQFSKTYRCHFGEEHNNFYHLGENLKILVQTFGTKIEDNDKVKKFYHGIGEKLVFPAYISNIYIYCPLSTSSEFCVAQNFTNDNNGMVVEFSGWQQSQCKYFSTSWLSDFGNECEYFFIQNQHSLEITNITFCEHGFNFDKILQPLKIIDSFTRYGKNIDNGKMIEYKNIIIKIIKHRLSSKLIKYKAFKSLHEYGKNLICTYFENKRKIWIGDSMEETYSFLLNFFIDLASNSIKFKEINILYPNMEELHVSNIDVCDRTMNDILEIISLQRNDTSKLRKIAIKININKYEENRLLNYIESFRNIEYKLSFSADSMLIEKMYKLNLHNCNLHVHDA